MNQGLVDALFLIFVLANVLMVPLGILAVLAARRVMAVPQPVLFPVILLFCVVGSFASNNTLFDVWLMLGLGLVAFVMEENDFPLAPMILGLILGPLVEENLMQSLIKSRGGFVAFFDRPIAGTLGAVTLGIWALMLTLAVYRQLRKARA
jgi:TctA family transporter